MPVLEIGQSGFWGGKGTTANTMVYGQNKVNVKTTV